MTNPETSFNPMNTHLRLVLTRPHTHSGKTRGTGDLIEADAPTADWLLAHGIAQHAIAVPPQKPAKTEADLSITTPRKESQS